MTSEIKDYFEQIVKYKAKRMMQNEGYRSYRQDLIEELKVKQLEEAFLIGAFDAMIFDVASALALGPAYMKGSSRRKLIKEILADS